MYHPPSQPDQYFFNTLDKALDVYAKYENVLLIGDFNAQIGETHIDTFLYQHELANISKEPTCYKNSENPSCIYFILFNRSKSFFKMNTAFTGLSDFHKIFRFSLRTSLGERCVKNYASFENFFLDALNKHAPLKKKVIRANHAPYVTKSLRKSIMKRSNLQKIYFKKRCLNH